MRVKSWGGLITNASPYAVPAGAALVQVNLCTDVPGQLTSRGGMLPVRFVGSAPGLLDTYPYEFRGQTVLVAMDESGNVVAMQSPAYGESEAPAEPSLSVAGGAVGTAYTLRYIDSRSGDTSDPPVQPPVGPADDYVTALVGSASPEFSVDAMEVCEGEGKATLFDGGAANTREIPLDIRESNLCELA